MHPNTSELFAEAVEKTDAWRTTKRMPQHPHIGAGA